ncbi:DUF2971 domain-containing protein [Coraliomargarita sp. W4R53]
MKYQYGTTAFIDFLKTGILRTKKITKLNDPLEFHPKNSHLPWIRVMLEAMADRFCSFSFTENPLNYLMWSYYADGHKGICIGFDFETPLFADILAASKTMFPVSTDGFLKVEYGRKERLDFDIEKFAPEKLERNLAEGLRFIGELARHKGEPWQHEQEYRLLHCQFDESIQGFTATTDSQHFYFDVGVESVKEVLIGVNCDKGTEDKIAELRMKYGGNYAIRRVCIADSTYDLK